MRRVRGVLGIAATWGAAFAVLGVALGALYALVRLLVADGLPGAGSGRVGLLLASIITRWALIGAVSGALFAVTLMIAERRQTLDTLSSRRLARWGMLAGGVGSAAVATVAVALLVRAGLFPAPGARLPLALAFGPVLAGALLGRATARATLRAARRDPSPLDDRSMTLDSNEAS